MTTSSARERMYSLTNPEEVTEFLEKFPTCAIFKAGGCHKTMQGFGYVETAIEGYPDLQMGFIRVIEWRPASNLVAEITGITHQSPQFILFKDGKPVYDVDNWEIVPEALEKSLTEHLGASDGEKSAVESVKRENVAIYLDLLQKFADEQMDQPTFKDQWLTTFQMDATPRSTYEFDLLNSLFGDVDEAIESEQNANLLQVKAKRPCMKHRAEQLLHKLEAVIAE